MDLPEYKIVIDVLSNGYSVEPLDKLLCFRKGRIKVTGPILLMDVLLEDLDEIYLTDCTNQIVLDVGGFLGESAALFHAWGAAKVVIYEPVLIYHEFIKMNIALNGINAELHDEGIGDTDGIAIVHYDTTDISFGLDSSGKKEMAIKVRSVENVIDESGADLAKFDCEGAEICLVGVPAEVLRKIDFYIIESHTLKTATALKNKFNRSGFDIVKEFKNESDKQVSIIFFKKA